MRPIVIRQGDTLTLLAYKLGFDASTVWNDDANAALRKMRSDPDILLATDILYVPDEGEPASFSLKVGTTNTFVSDPPTVTIKVHFADPRFASQSYKIEELDYLMGLTTDEAGVAAFDAPVTLSSATIDFAALGVTCSCRIGYLDPIETLSGVVQRLQALGYLPPDDAFDLDDHDAICDALQALKDCDGAYCPAAFETPMADLSPDRPISITVYASPGTVQYPLTSTQDGDSDPPSEEPDSTDDPGSDDDGETEDVTVNDDGTIDDASRARLLRAYGC
jgi:hypothetical protein